MITRANSSFRCTPGALLPSSNVEGEFYPHLGKAASSPLTGACPERSGRVWGEGTATADSAPLAAPISPLPLSLKVEGTSAAYVPLHLQDRTP